mgnify:CR=1 FL=1
MTTMCSPPTDKVNYMKYALKEAKKAYLKNEVPVGAIIVRDGEIIAKAHNQKVSTKNIFGHAEILAIKKAANKINVPYVFAYGNIVFVLPRTRINGVIKISPTIVINAPIPKEKKNQSFLFLLLPSSDIN